MSEGELAGRAAGGDAEAFGVLIDRYTPLARRVARAVLGSAEDGDDAAQDGFLLAWRAIDRFDSSRPFRPWLVRIVVNAARDLHRRRRIRRTEAVPADHADHRARPDREAARALLRERLTAALAQLPDRQRVAVTLFDAEGFSHAEIAGVLGVPEGTVRSDVFHARRALRRHLEPFLEEIT